VGAAANPTRVTQGDAQAVFEAFPNGGWAILQHSTVAAGAPADGLVGGLVTIRPLKPFDRIHVCALDWHTIVLADIEGGDTSFTAQDADAIIATLTVSFTLDGSDLATTRTAIKPFLNPARFGLDVAYAAQWGRVMAPSDLSVGQHSLSVVESDPSGVVFKNKITFFVDAAGSGACL